MSCTVFEILTLICQKWRRHVTFDHHAHLGDNMSSRDKHFWGLAPFDRAHRPYKFLLAFHSNCVPILHRFWDTPKYWSKSADVNLPHLYLVPPFGVMSLEFRRYFWQRKTGVPGLSYGVVSVILSLAIFVQLRLVTDRRTDRPTMTANTMLP